MANPKKFKGFVLRNETTKLYWCSRHTWVSTLTRAWHFKSSEDAQKQVPEIRVKERDTAMPLKVINLKDLL